MSHYNKKKTNPRFIYLIILILALLAAATIGVVAKYIQNNKEEFVSTATAFYFSSDLLKDDGATYELTPDTTKITFSLQNFEDEWRKSKSDIKYDVYMNDTKIVENGVLNESNPQKNVTIDVESGKTYTVRATATYPYAKELTATFTVRERDMNIYKKLEDFGHYVILTVYTKDFSGKITISFPENLIPDKSDEKFEGTNNLVDGKYEASTVAKPLQIDMYSSVTYRFLKVDPEQTYSNDQDTLDKFVIAIVD